MGGGDYRHRPERPTAISPGPLGFAAFRAKRGKNALGTRHASNVALKGQKLWLSMLLPFRGDFCYNTKTQGDALGYVLVGLSGRPPSPLLQQPNAFLEQGTVEVVLGDVEQAVQLFHAKLELVIR